MHSKAYEKLQQMMPIAHLVGEKHQGLKERTI